MGGTLFPGSGRTMGSLGRDKSSERLGGRTEGRRGVEKTGGWGERRGWLAGRLKGFLRHNVRPWTQNQISHRS